MGNGRTIWFQIEKGEHEEAMILKYIVLKGHKNIFRFSFFSRKITEWNKLVEKTVTSQSLFILAKFL